MTPKQEKAFLSALEEMVTEKGISKEIVIDAIAEAFRVAYNKRLSDELLVVQKNNKNKKPVAKKFDEEGNEIKQDVNKLADALIDCDINLEKGRIKTTRKWLIVKEDDLQDDFVEISNEDERIKGKKYKLGDYYEEPLSFDDFSKGDVNRFVSAYKQKISRAEKDSLLEAFKGKIGELVTGVVEKSDDHSCIVNLGRVSVTLFQKDLIGKETFKSGDSIKVYVCGINKDDVKGSSTIHCSRSCPEFVAKIFANEVHEIYDGTVKIHKVARIVGNRSKVAVYSEDPNVDASGACIGQNGSRIQLIVSQLGNDRYSKEKVDVIDYSPNLGLFLKECVKPGNMIGAKFETTSKGNAATVICEDGTSSAAIGFKGVNVILARQLTGLAEIKILDESAAVQAGVTEWTTISEFEAEAREMAKEKFRENSIKNAEIVSQIKSTITEVGPTVNDEEEMDEAIEEEIAETIVDTQVEEAKPVEVKTTKKAEKRAEVKQETVKPTKVEEPVEHVSVKTTISINDLEANLESEKQTKKTSDYKKKKKVEKVEEVKQTVVEEKDRMAIYSEEELEAIAREEAEEDVYDEDEEDYSDYDDDSLYEDK